jgi:quinohemoprotein amine dehydrogenase
LITERLKKDNMRRGRSINARTLARAVAILLTLAMPRSVRGQTEPGIPVTDPLVLAKCGACHTVDERGNMERISWARATPEGWQAATKRMIAENGVSVTPLEARSIVKYLSTRNGLAPEEAKPVMYAAERRIHDESDTGSDSLQDACARCHQAALALSWRRTADDWKRFGARHADRYQFTPDQAAMDFLLKAAPLHTREWDVWSARPRTAELGGRWLVTARLAGRGNFYGEMDVEATGGGDEFLTRTRLRSVDGTAVLTRTGRSLAYGGTAWRGRSSGRSPAGTAPDDPGSAAQEAMLIAPDGSSVEGRWFWGQYEELGFDVKMQRPPSDPILLLVEPRSFKAGSSSNRIRLIGDHFPAQVTTADLSAGPALTVRRIVSSTPSEIVAELDVARDAPPGRRNIAFRSSTLERAVAIYDRIDYVKVIPDSSLAAFSNETYLRGYQQFEAVGYQRGPDGRRHTADDLELGPVDVTWSMEVFYEVDQSKQDRVGTLSPAGFFTPASANPGINDDVWIIATAKNEKGSDGKPLVGKSYLVVTVPTYTFNGRTYVRDLDRWIEERSSGR